MKTRAKLVNIGRQEGDAQELERAARKLKLLGVSAETIAAGFGLTPEEIARL
jgi:hypothetical protein